MFAAMALDQSLVCDPRYMDFDYWASLMCEKYAAQQLPIPDPYTDWKSWGAGMTAIEFFANQGFPSPYAYDEWQEWASAVVGVMNGGN